MRALIRIVSILAGVTVLATVWFIVGFAANGGLGPLFESGLLGVLTIGGWLITLVAGPVAAVQLWRHRDSGRRAGIILFGSSLAYYVIGFLTVRSPEAPVGPIAVVAAFCAAPLFVLLHRRTRMLMTGATSPVVTDEAQPSHDAGAAN